MNQEIYYIAGGLLLVYILITRFNKRQGKQRKSRNFMEGRRLKDRRDPETGAKDPGKK